MNPNHFDHWTPPPELLSHIETIFRRTQTPQSGRDYVLHALRSGPARAVQAHHGNTCVRHYSKKMGATMMLESRRGESVRAWQLESDPTVRAYFAQPPTVTLFVYRDDGTTSTRLQYTADFMVVTDDRIQIDEVRDDARFLADSKKNPNRYYRDANGKYRQIPAEKHFAELGLDYSLMLVSELPHRLIENNRFLEDYRQESCPPLTDGERNAVVAAVVANRWVPLEVLLRNGIAADSIYKAIIEGAIHVPLNTTRLADTSSVKLFADEATAQSHALIDALDATPPPPIPGTLMLRSGHKIRIYDREYSVILQGERDVALVDPMGYTTFKSVQEIDQLHKGGHATGDGFRPSSDRMPLWSASKTKVFAAMERLRAAKDPHQTTFSERSISRFRARIVGAVNDVEAIEMLMDVHEKRGNRQPRISELCEEHLQRAIDAHFNTPDRPTAKGAYKKYVNSLESLREPGGGKVAPVSLQTFTRRCKQRKSIVDREGKRAAYRQAPIVALLSNEYPAHGFRPHDVIYMDHTIADIETQSPDGLPLRKPTLTAAVDGTTRHVRAFVLLYEPASARAVMLVIRAYIDKWGRLPRCIVVDNGKEFHSNELEYLCRIYGIEIRYRGPAQPRGGALIERTFGSINEEVLAELEGNSRCMKSSTREITAAVNPQNRVRWNLTALHGAVSTYLFEEHANRTHPDLGLSPNEFEEKSYLQTGAREHMLLKLDENAMLLTSPHPQHRAKRKVIEGRGVNVYGIYYRHPSMANVSGQSVEVRVEWWNASVVYAHINNRWVTAIGTSARFLSNRGNRENEMANRVHMREAGERARKNSIARAGSNFGSRKLEPSHFDPFIAAQENEVRRLYKGLGTMGALAVPLPKCIATHDVGSSLAINQAPNPINVDETIELPPSSGSPGNRNADLTRAKPAIQPPSIEEDEDDDYASMSIAMGLR